MMIKAVLSLAVLAVTVLLLAGCVGPGQPGQETPTPGQTSQQTPVQMPAGPPSPASESIADANNHFALDIYSRLAQDTDGNIFFSPYSISSAMAITFEGARGETAEEILSVFHFPQNRTLMREGFSGTIAAINNRSSAYTLRTANALWAEKTFPFLPEYTSTAEQTYRARTTNLDFVTMPEQSRAIVNQWVEEQTDDKIKDLLPAGSINPLTRLIITNAIYFKGTWAKQFDENKTTEEDFRTGNGTTVRVKMMQRTDQDAIYPYNETETLQLLAMPYESGNGTRLSMLVLLPRNGDLDHVAGSLDATSLSGLRQNLTPQRVIVYFPKFTMETKYSLAPVLSDLGMPTAFTGTADFSGMDGRRDLYIDDVIHQAFIDVNEEGTEAAAATAVIMGAMAVPVKEKPIPVFRADHSFLFLIQDDETGNILFMGRVDTPATA
jgi:serpin B